MSGQRNAMFSLREAAALITGASVLGDDGVTFDRVSTDSRSAGPGDTSTLQPVRTGIGLERIAFDPRSVMLGLFPQQFVQTPTQDCHRLSV